MPSTPSCAKERHGFCSSNLDGLLPLNLKELNRSLPSSSSNSPAFILKSLVRHFLLLEQRNEHLTAFPPSPAMAATPPERTPLLAQKDLPLSSKKSTIYGSALAFLVRSSFRCHSMRLSACGRCSWLFQSINADIGPHVCHR